MNKEILDKYISEGWVRVQHHPTFPLSIYNYTQNTQYKGYWDEVTMACRGLVLDDEYNVVGRPFGKFFNLSELNKNDIPYNESFQIYEKMDGSFIELFKYDGKIIVASKGSFTSDHTFWAREILLKKYLHILPLIEDDKTYIFELIHPENRIVVNYGDMSDLILLSVVDNFTGKDKIEHIGFPVVKEYFGIKDLETLSSKVDDNHEGFVIKWANGMRAKVKGAEYCKLHRIMTNITTYDIWEWLKDDKDWEDLIAEVPDEMYDWVKSVVESIRKDYMKIFSEMVIEILKIRDEDIQTSKDLYFRLQQTKHFNPLFCFYKRTIKDMNEVIFKQIKPKFSKPVYETTTT